MKRKTFEGMVLRALNILLHTVAKYAGPKTDDLIAEWKADAREYLREPHETMAEELAAAEVIEHYAETLRTAKAEGRVVR